MYSTTIATLEVRSHYSDGADDRPRGQRMLRHLRIGELVPDVAPPESRHGDAIPPLPSCTTGDALALALEHHPRSAWVTLASPERRGWGAHGRAAERNAHVPAD